jgi:hypothetical protein
MAESLCSPPIAGRPFRSKSEQQVDITGRNGAGKKGDTLSSANPQRSQQLLHLWRERIFCDFSTPAALGVWVWHAQATPHPSAAPPADLEKARFSV